MNIAATIDLSGAAARRWPVVVVGAGPAGSLAAREVARRGVAVLLVDRAEFPRRKVCGCCLNACALAALDSAGLGDLVARCGGRPLSAVRLATQGAEAAVSLPGGAALSREVFDAELVNEAVASGVAFLPGTTVAAGACAADGRRLVLRHGGRRAEVVADVVLAADGLGSALMETTSPAGARLGAGAVADDGPTFYAEGGIHLACGRGGYAGLVRLEDGRLDIAAALDTSFVRRRGGLGPAVAALLRETDWPPVPGLERLAWKGTPLLSRRPRRVAEERLLALGDAAGYVEPFTGEGMAWALSGALAAAPLVVGGWTPTVGAVWRAVHARRVRRRQQLAVLAAWALRRPLLVRTIVHLLHLFPRLATPVVRRLNVGIRSAGQTSGH